ncbi:unnamed protein product [Rotaria sp. Silwood1]|nr:unnamed protein product [Rotaria sp. Silwood1]CAF1514694.1 unnamed protein product [Rotaria sp. Silwood1]CAF1516096.1 unnamed protein product [Rotaria sp. Silwood1]CAF3565813.1 unnamed protein product [Rotaria sp. Silwood1]CAF3619289.1 unnamed protein product [Rotaria sp. Silwood1]
MVETQKSSTALQQITSNDVSTICSKCGEKILNVMTADENKVYHPHCFNCSDCGKTLAGGFFYKSKNSKSDESTITSRNSLAEPLRFCEICYKKVAPKCARCHNIIEASSIVWEDKKFHETCFTCWGVDKNGVQCQKPMKDEPVYPLNDKWYCKICFDKLDTGVSAAARDILSQKCRKCYKEFAPGSLVSEYKGDYYHPTCFICSQCNTSIASKSFYHQSKSDDQQSEAKFLCENCHIKNAQECAECKNKIVNGEAIGFEGKQYHRSCFTCQNCHNEIGTAHFFKTKDGKYICQQCSLQQQHDSPTK